MGEKDPAFKTEEKSLQLEPGLSGEELMIYWNNQLPYNKVKGWNIMADFFAASLIFFAVSDLLIVKGKNSISGRGK
ncbi:MAG: hypothetical protein AB2L24_27245 [Mangrovibacterium sp.]